MNEDSLSMKRDEKRDVACNASPIICVKSVTLFQLFYSDIPEFHFRTVTKEADVSGFVQQSRMIFLIYGAVFGRFTDVAVDNSCSIKNNFYVIAIGNYFLIIPLAWFQIARVAVLHRKPSRDIGKLAAFRK